MSETPTDQQLAEWEAWFAARSDERSRIICVVSRALREARDEIERLTAGVADEPGDPAANPTPGQFLRRLLDLPADRRLTIVARMQQDIETAIHCFQLNHDELLAERDALRNALNAIGASAANLFNQCGLTGVQAIAELADRGLWLLLPDRSSGSRV